MNTTMTAAEARREFLKISAGVTGAGLLGAEAMAQGNTLNYNTWSAAVDLVRGHTNAFTQKTGIKVNYANSPWAQYRDTMVTRFVAKAPMDVVASIKERLEFCDSEMVRIKSLLDSLPKE